MRQVFNTRIEWESALEHQVGIIPDTFPEIYRSSLITVVSRALEKDCPGKFPVQADAYNCHRVVAEALRLDPVNYLMALNHKDFKHLAVETPVCGDLSIIMNKVDGNEFPSHSAFVLAPEVNPMKTLTIAKLGFGRPVVIETVQNYYDAQQVLSQREAMKIDGCYTFVPVRYTVPLRSFLGLLGS